MGWCRVYECWREAAPGSDFCLLKHGWGVGSVVPVIPLPQPPEPEPVEVPVLVLVQDCVGCEEEFEQLRRQGRPFLYCEMCRGVAA